MNLHFTYLPSLTTVLFFIIHVKYFRINKSESRTRLLVKSYVAVIKIINQSFETRMSRNLRQ